LFFKVAYYRKAEQLELPQTAGYYVVLLAANSQQVQAQKYLEIAIKANMLHKEEVFINALSK
jgi:hypothetical protein